MNTDKAFTKQLQQKSVTDPTQNFTPPQPSDPALAHQLASTVDKCILEEETPDLHQLFSYFNCTYFGNQLNKVKVKWSSSQMTKRYTHYICIIYHIDLFISIFFFPARVHVKSIMLVLNAVVL